MKDSNIVKITDYYIDINDILYISKITVYSVDVRFYIYFKISRDPILIIFEVSDSYISKQVWKETGKTVDSDFSAVDSDFRRVFIAKVEILRRKLAECCGKVIDLDTEELL